MTKKSTVSLRKIKLKLKTKRVWTLASTSQRNTTSSMRRGKSQSPRTTLRRIIMVEAMISLTLRCPSSQVKQQQEIILIRTTLKWLNLFLQGM
jgi:hypothetical protein